MSIGMTSSQMALRDPDIRLMLRVRDGDDAAFAELVERFQHRLVAVMHLLLGSLHEAEDLAQEAFLRVYRTRKKYRPQAKFSTWLFTIARNLVIDLSRKRTMASLEEMSGNGEDDRPFEIAVSGPSPLEQFQSRENCAEIGEVLLKLDPSYREVLGLRFYEELSLEEIAGVTRAPLSTVKSRLYRGLAALKPEMEQLRAPRTLLEVAP
mgnify:CR=1 FL=1